ncbi:hypothetical protein [Paraburkholderia sp. BL10I2N1]|uniref:hypothetical protein n=1 Tax=Paraburkholderia sp. BL10I2N1 TaxID=1938796 RepID=UPI00105B6842|nr:hypothetical protein [Paraburkholderia sp. BL10I2N1]TDN68247.1 hypothetical protein B0G77_1565 [Paraburkholderia sp. BL10I2N1]
MNTPADNRFATIPTYAELIEELAVGFGLADSPARKLSTARSWIVKQARYATKTPHPKNRGLADELVMLLAGEAPELATKLDSCFRQYEGLLSHLRGRALFSRRSHLHGLAYFLTGWVFPQVAVLLWRGKDWYGPSSPLFHIPDLLPPFGDGDYDAVRRVKQAVRAQLHVEGEVSTADFRNALNKLDARSDKKLTTMNRELKALGDELRPQTDAVLLASVVSKARAAYVAGIAVKRFLGRLLRLAPGNPAQFLGSVRYYYEMLQDPEKDPEGARFISSHLQLFNELMSSDLLDVVDPDRADSPFLLLVDCHWKAVGEIVPGECAPLRSLWALFNERRVSSAAFELASTAFEHHTDYAVLMPYAAAAHACFALARGDVPNAQAGFHRALQRADRQQLGELGELAANCAIALEVMFSAHWRPGCLDPLITYLAQTKKQRSTLSLGHPTPFCTFSDLPARTAADELVLDAICYFNAWQYPTVVGVERIFCNPLARFDGTMGTFFSYFDREIDQHVGRDLAIQNAVDRTFNTTARAQTVIRFLHVTPYEALRDLWFYMPRLFGSDGIVRFTALNPYLERYIRLPESEERAILHALDAACHDKDIGRYHGRR